MEYLITIYKKDSKRPQIEKLLRVTEKEMFAFIQEHSAERERGVLFTVSKVEVILDFSYEI